MVNTLAPIGMQNLFVINSALTNKRKRALLTALIVIFFDITLSLACFFGIGTITGFNSLRTLSGITQNQNRLA